MLREPRYHPVKEIEGVKSESLRDKVIVFGLTGSSAIYRSIDAMRELIRRGARVYTVMSDAAIRLISPTLIEWATGAKVFTEFKGEVGHVGLGKECSSMVIAPATADILVKISLGICDNPVSLVATEVMGLNKPLIVVPAMHLGLWRSKTVAEAVNRLEGLGVTLIPPVTADGKAKYPSLEDIVAAVEAISLRGRDLRGFRILVTAGPTRELLDEVRFISNPSTGKMGVAIAREAYFRGANVTLVHGPLTINAPHYIRRIEVLTTEEMLKAVVTELKGGGYDAVILAAAPSDFKFAETFKGKLSSDISRINVTLESTPKISVEVRKVFKGVLVGFAAECTHGDREELLRRARIKLGERGFDVVVANDVCVEGVGFGSDVNEVDIITKEGEVIHVSRTLKEAVGRRVLDVVKGLLHREIKG